MTRVVERWFLVEPLLFGVWSTHRVIAATNVRTLRVGGGKVEYNPDFIARLSESELAAVLSLEALRIVLGHPYARRKERSDLSYQASNITLEECLRTPLPIPTAHEVFGTHEHDGQYYDYYYARLLEQEGASSAPETSDGSSALDAHISPPDGGIENTAAWEADDLFAEQVREKVMLAEESRSWGTLAGALRERILAAHRPKVDYAEILRAFRASIISSQRYLTRMKPSRRYGEDAMGSRYQPTSRLLFAVDVSGSMASEELAVGFSIVGRLFSHAVAEIDVIAFDTRVIGPPLTLRRARHEFDITGRGGTRFQPVIDYLDEHPRYDGLIIYTDGEAPIPAPPKRATTRIVWLYVHEAACKRHEASLGRAAFVRA